MTNNEIGQEQVILGPDRRPFRFVFNEDVIEPNTGHDKEIDRNNTKNTPPIEIQQRKTALTRLFAQEQRGDQITAEHKKKSTPRKPRPAMGKSAMY